MPLRVRAFGRFKIQVEDPFARIEMCRTIKAKSDRRKKTLGWMVHLGS
jgi:hypothetical protein